MDDQRGAFTPSPHPSNRPLSCAKFNEDSRYDCFPKKISCTGHTNAVKFPARYQPSDSIFLLALACPRRQGMMTGPISS